jgi:FkbM family methyltransferase
VQQEKFYWTGAYERAVQDVLVELVQPGDVVWDIGAHVGYFTLLLSHLVGPSGKVVAFEPVSDNRLRLEESLRLNGVANVVVRCEAAGSSCGQVMLHSRGSSLTWTLRGDEVDPTAVLSVPSVTLDEVAAKGEPPALLKIDAEDAEVDVLRGATTLLAHHRPYIVVELVDPAMRYECLSVASGYSARSLDDRHCLLVPPRASDE